MGPPESLPDERDRRASAEPAGDPQTPVRSQSRQRRFQVSVGIALGSVVFAAWLHWRSLREGRPASDSVGAVIALAGGMWLAYSWWADDSAGPLSAKARQRREARLAREGKGLAAPAPNPAFRRAIYGALSIGVLVYWVTKVDTASPWVLLIVGILIGSALNRKD